MAEAGGKRRGRCLALASLLFVALVTANVAGTARRPAGARLDPSLFGDLATGIVFINRSAAAGPPAA
jgi:hypothetical protein